MTLIGFLEVAAGLLLAAGLAWSLAVRSAERRVLGEQIGAEWGSPLARFLVVVPAVAAGIWVALEVGVGAGFAELLLLAGAVALTVLRPSFDDRVSGTLGVRRGWQVLTHDQLDEWRLIGEHLRFRLFGEWTAVPVPVDRQVALRERLTTVAADRESRFGHGSGRPDYDPPPTTG